jgi:hypothetical protein
MGRGTGPSSEKRTTNQDSQTKCGYSWLVVPPSNDTSRLEAKRTPTILSIRLTSRNAKRNHMRRTFRGSCFLRFLWHEQGGLCPVCNTKITRITGWRLPYCFPRVKGGSSSAENRVLLHPDAITGFIAYVILYPNRVPFKGALEVLEPDDGKLSRPVLRGRNPSNGVRLLDRQKFAREGWMHTPIRKEQRFCRTEMARSRGRS